MFDGSIIVSQNEELIFTRGKNQSRESVDIMVVHQLPRNGAGGYGSQGMTQKQCDAYYMNDGTNCPGMNDVYKEFDGYKGRYDSRPRAEGYVETKELADYPELGPLGVGVSKQYVQREPRFYASVGYNGSTWHLLNALNDNTHDEEKNIQVFYYRGGSNGYANSSYWLRTGIGIKKYVHPNDISYTQKNSYDVDRIEHKADPAIRYAEVLLIYAEALNELTGSYEVPSWDGSKMHSVKRDITEMKKGIRPIRIRAGLPDYDKVKGSRAKFNDLIATPYRTYETDKKGEYLITGVPNLYDSPAPPLHTDELPYNRWFTFLLEAEYKGEKKYVWLPEYEVQQTFFENKDTYQVTIDF